MITSVDEEARHADLPNLQAEHDQEITFLKKQLDSDIAAISQDLEEELAQLEKAGAKAAEREKAKSLAEKTMGQVRKRAEAEIDQMEDVWERFKNLKVGDLEGEEHIFRAMRDKYGEYFEGSMGAESIQRRLQNFDLQGEAEKLHEIIQTGRGQRKTRALKRLKVVNAFLTKIGRASCRERVYIRGIGES